jgi:hypothetical protein
MDLAAIKSGRSACVHDGNVNSMVATPVLVRSSASASLLRKAGSLSRPILVPAAQLLPSMSFLAVFFALPAVTLISYSFLTQSPQGTVGLPLTLEHHRHFFGTPRHLGLALSHLRRLWLRSLHVGH